MPESRDTVTGAAPAARSPGLGRRAAAHGAVSLLFAALAVAWSFPLVLHLSTHVPGTGPGDNLVFVWNVWWAREALALHLDPLYTNFIFYPIGVNLAQHTHTALNGLVGATLLAALSPVTAQNVLLLAALFLNGFTTYLLVLRLASSRFAAVVAGVVFGGAPAVLVRLLGHFNLVGAWVIPTAILLLVVAVERRTLGARLWAGVGFAIAAYVDYYYFVYAIVLGAIYLFDRWFAVDAAAKRRAPNVVSRVCAILFALALVLAAAVAVAGGFVVTVGGVRISMTETRNLHTAAWLFAAAWVFARLRPRVRLSSRHRAGADLAILAPAGATFAVLASPLIAATAMLVLRGQYATQTYLWRSAPAGVDLASYVLGNPLHALYGAATERMYSVFGLNPIEGVAWTGAIAACLVVWGWRQRREESETGPWRAALVLFGLWSLGPWLTVFGTTTGAILPGILLRYVPLAANARIPGRAAVPVALAVAVLVGFALRKAERRGSVRAKTAIVALVVAETVTAPLPLYRLPANRVYSYLATRPAGAVLELPLGLRDGFGEIGQLDSRSLYFQTLSGKSMFGGFVARLSPAVKRWYEHEPVISTLLTLSSPAVAATWQPPAVDKRTAHDVLAGLSARYVVVDGARASTELRDYVRRLPLRFVMEDQGRELYELQTP